MLSKLKECLNNDLSKDVAAAVAATIIVESIVLMLTTNTES